MTDSPLSSSIPKTTPEITPDAEMRWVKWVQDSMADRVKHPQCQYTYDVSLDEMRAILRAIEK